jgi:hypothetical protein
MRSDILRNRWTRGMTAALLLSLMVSVALCAPAASARPLIDAPTRLLNEVRQPCVLYVCATDPGAHTNWENSLGALRTDYCAQYHCSPMDLVPSNGFDDNLFPFDPNWGSFVETGQPPDANQLCGQFEHGSSFLGSPPCSSQPVSLDAPGVDTEAYFACPAGRSPYFGSFHGHINWEPATYQGTLTWGEHSAPGTDDDYSLTLRTPNGDGATAANAPSSIGLEFDSDETIDHFDDNPWWKGFHDAVHLSDFIRLFNLHAPDPAAQDVNGHLAVVTGLIGLDTAHSPATESHPVYAMALQTDRTLALAGGIDRWAFFVRNWGDEGYCSQHDHPLPAGPLTVRIPWLVGATGAGGVRPDPATGVTLVGSDVSSMNVPHSGPITMSVLPGEGVLLTFDLSTKPSREPEYWGTVDLHWTFGQPQPPPNNPGSIQRREASLTNDTEDSDVEALVARLWNWLPRKARSKALALLPHPRTRSHATRRVPIAVTPAPTSSVRTVGAFVLPVLDRALLAFGLAEHRAICQAYNNHVPRLADRLLIKCPSPANEDHRR